MFNKFDILYRKIIFLLFCTVLITSCSATSVTRSWVEPGLEKSYSHPMIIGRSDSQQTRRIYEQYFVDELKKRNITAIPSYTLINSKQKLDRDTVLAAIHGTDIDSVLVTYLISADAELRYHDSPLGNNYSGSPEDNMMSATMITTRGRASSEEIVTLKNDLYDAQSAEIIWSAQTQTVAVKSIDELIKELTALLIDGLVSDGVIK